MELNYLIKKRRWYFYYSQKENEAYCWSRKERKWLQLTHLQTNIQSVQVIGTTDLRHWPSPPCHLKMVAYVFEIYDGLIASHKISRIPLDEVKEGG